MPVTGDDNIGLENLVSVKRGEPTPRMQEQSGRLTQMPEDVPQNPLTQFKEHAREILKDFGMPEGSIDNAVTQLAAASQRQLHATMAMSASSGRTHG